MAMSMSIIQYCERIESTTLLGPGNRAVLWVFGCCFDCPGCIAKNFRTGEFICESVDEMASWILNTSCSDLTISGGEPFLQSGPLSKMIQTVRKHRNIGVIVYTGFEYEELMCRSEQSEEIRSFLKQIDVLIDGPYKEELDHNEPYRGSGNQRIIQLTDRYKDSIRDYYYSSEGRKVEIKIQYEKTLMVGVPSKEQAQIWESIKRLSGESDQ